MQFAAIPHSYEQLMAHCIKFHEEKVMHDSTEMSVLFVRLYSYWLKNKTKEKPVGKEVAVGMERVIH